MNPIFEQTIYYLIVMLLGIIIIGFLQKGFLFNYLRVRLSFGKFVLVKVRAINRDFFAVGKIKEGFLIYKVNKEDKRIQLNDNNCFYKCIGITFIDVSDEKNAVCLHNNYSSQDGFDAVKFQNLYLRALYKPTLLNNNKEKIIFLLIFGACILALIGAYYGYTSDIKLTQIALQLTKAKAGSVTPAVI